MRKWRSFFLRAGRVCDKLSFLREGLVRVFASHGDKEVTRVFSLLSMSGEERYSYLQRQNPDLFDTVPLKYLASMMGMTPESLSRIRKKK